ncbi:MAG: 2-amino-4-hydroxy-6-hydroxymethyldihydropteridine diphosphokinase [Burkholderiales bacterium]|nr:2-amino-4-hydroxy-6-hydroxymethyldihydropteridine diphosphokinase [Burkholderiales bacterium]
MACAFIGLGANLGEPLAQIDAALAELGRLPRTRLLRASSFYRSAPIGNEAQPDFVNAVAALETELTPRELLEALLRIEHASGRVRTFPNAPRMLDLDLLLYDACAVDESGLAIPHPRMHERAFVLAPLAEIAPEAVIPGHGCAADLLRRVAGQRIERLDRG